MCIFMDRFILACCPGAGVRVFFFIESLSLEQFSTKATEPNPYSYLTYRRRRKEGLILFKSICWSEWNELNWNSNPNLRLIIPSHYPPEFKFWTSLLRSVWTNAITKCINPSLDSSIGYGLNSRTNSLYTVLLYTDQHRPCDIGNRCWKPAFMA